MTVLPELERDLIALADRSAAGRPTLQRPRMVGMVGGALSIAVTVAVAVLVAAGHGQRAAATHTPPAAMSADQKALLAVLGVMRAPQTPGAAAFAERGWPAPPRARTTLDRPLIRLATMTPWRANVYIVAIKPPASRTLARSLGETVALWIQGIGWSDYATVGDITTGRAWGPGHTASVDGHTVYRFFEIVPDGVTRVVFKVLPRMPDPGQPAHFTASINAVVHNNVAAFQTPQTGPGAVFAIWYGRDGHISKRVGDWGLLNPPKTHLSPQPHS